MEEKSCFNANYVHVHLFIEKLNAIDNEHFELKIKTKQKKRLCVLNARIPKILISETIDSTRRIQLVYCVPEMNAYIIYNQRRRNYYHFIFTNIFATHRTETKHKTNFQEVNGKFWLCMRFIILRKYYKYTTFCRHLMPSSACRWWVCIVRVNVNAESIRFTSVLLSIHLTAFTYTIHT